MNIKSKSKEEFILIILLLYFPMELTIFRILIYFTKESLSPTDSIKLYKFQLC